MLFNKDTRALNSRTGYFKSYDGCVYNKTIYLGVKDTPSNYTPITKNEYEKIKERGIEHEHKR